MSTRRLSADTQKGVEDWHFFSFPVFTGVAAGMLIACLIAIAVPFVFYVLFLISLGMFSFCIAHIVITGTKMRSTRTRQARQEEDEIERRILAERGMADAEGTSSRRARRRRGR